MGRTNMPTLSRAESARINGAKSRGPKTEAGKNRSRLNAITHGMSCSPKIALINEAGDEFNRVYHAYVAKHNPQDQEELDAITQLVSSRWRLFRGWGFETEMVNENLKAIYAEIAKDPATAGTASSTRTFMAFERALKESRLLNLLPRYETNLRHQLNQAETRLRRLIAERKDPEADGLFEDETQEPQALEAVAAIATNVAPNPKTPAQSEPNFTHRPGRNTPCPCGSGLKFKRCCISKMPRAA